LHWICAARLCGSTNHEGRVRSAQCIRKANRTRWSRASSPSARSMRCCSSTRQLRRARTPAGRCGPSGRFDLSTKRPFHSRTKTHQAKASSGTEETAGHASMRFVKSVSITMRLPTKQFDELWEAARRERQSVSDVIRRWATWIGRSTWRSVPRRARHRTGLASAPAMPEG
jgi:hypothetical protein